MRKIIASAATAALTASLFAAAPAVAGGKADGKSPSHSTTGHLTAGVDTRRLEQAVTVNGILQHLRALQTIANRNDGNRASGLPGHTASVDYVVKQLRQAGYVVKRQKFTFAFSRDLEPGTLRQVSPTARSFETQTFDYSGSGDVTGKLVDVDLTVPPAATPSSTSGCEASDFTPASTTEQQVALIQRGTCDFATKVDNAQAAGYDAVVVFNEGQEGRQELLQGTLGAPKSIPVVGLSYEDGAALANETDAVVRVTTKTENDLNRQTENVIADLPTSAKPKNADQTVVVGAHLDSVAEGPGINDNGSGSATILEIAQQLADGRYLNRLQRPVRFAFWGAEEKGLLGSQHYVDNLSTAQRSKIYANLNFDMVGSPNYVRFVYDGDGSDGGVSGPPGSDAIEKVFTSYFSGKKLASSPTDFDGRSDYGPFIAEGIPAGGLFSGAEGIKTEAEAATYGGTAGKAYDSCYHQACDTITNINTKAVNELGDAAAHATLVLIASKQGLFPDGSRQAPKTLAKAERPVPGSHDSVAK